jgi:predicted DNA-binding transcriptional regulator YafY
MRAARVLDMLLVLQRRGRTTAGALADALEVSERTILRDVEALSEAGVPIYATRGAGGGIELLDGFRTRLTGLTVDEARSLFLAGQPQVAHRLGLAVPARAARAKLLEALPAGQAEEADGVGDWFVQDPDPWVEHRVPHGELRRLARCVQQRRRVELTFGHDAPVAVEPLGLALKAGEWYLVVRRTAATDVVPLADLRATRITRHSFERPSGFDLGGFWKDHVARSTRPAAASG